MPIPASVLIAALQHHLGEITRAELAHVLNVTPATVGNWLNDVTTPTNPQVERIVKAFSDHVGRQLVQPIFEYKPINPIRNGNRWHFGIPAPEAEAHRAELLNKHGIYIFYSSVGTVIYLGKSTNCLYNESRSQPKSPAQASSEN